MMEIRVCYADTDAGGVVYYGNYLRFLEQGRTEFLRERGLPVRELRNEGYLFPVVHLELDYRASAVLDDLLRVETAVREVGGASFTLDQRVLRALDGKVLVEGTVSLACIGESRRARRLPEALLEVLQRP